MPKPILRNKLDAGEFFFAPGIHDMVTAAVANEIGFEAVYATGYWLTASAYGLPDAGIATYSQMVDRVGTLARSMPNSAVIADADTGYGGLLNVHHTVRGYEEAGACAIQIEDQEFPKKCGHTPFKRVVPVRDMVEKIQVACAARRDPRNTLIIARTDSLSGEGFEKAVGRCQAYAEAGADIIFFEAPTSEEQMREACRLVAAPMIANMADGGKTPIRSASVLQGLGYACAIYPAMTALAAAHAAAQALQHLKDTGSSLHPQVPLFDFEHFCELIGFDEVWAFERQWARQDT